MTDPPYGVDYVGKTADALAIQNDTQGEVEVLVGAAFALAAAVLEPGAAVYCAHPAGVQGLVFARLFDEAFCGQPPRPAQAQRPRQLSPISRR